MRKGEETTRLIVFDYESERLMFSYIQTTISLSPLEVTGNSVDEDKFIGFD